VELAEKATRERSLHEEFKSLISIVARTLKCEARSKKKSQNIAVDQSEVLHCGWWVLKKVDGGETWWRQGQETETSRII